MPSPQSFVFPCMAANPQTLPQQQFSQEEAIPDGQMATASSQPSVAISFPPLFMHQPGVFVPHMPFWCGMDPQGNMVWQMSGSSCVQPHDSNYVWPLPETSCDLPAKKNRQHRRNKCQMGAQQGRKKTSQLWRKELGDLGLENPEVEQEMTSSCVEQDNSATAVKSELENPLSLVSEYEGESAKFCEEICDRLLGDDVDDRAKIIEWLHPETLRLSLSGCGCRVMQKVVMMAQGEQRDLVVNNLRGHVAELSDCKHGNHVLQKCIECLPCSSVQFVLDELAQCPGGWAGFANTQFGCRIVERLVEHAHHDMLNGMVTSLVKNMELGSKSEFQAVRWCCTDRYGNYVIQHILEHCKVHHEIMADALVKADVVQLCMDHIGSNVVEKALTEFEPPLRTKLLRAILNAAPLQILADSRSRGRMEKRNPRAPVMVPALVGLLCHRFGNYTVKTIFQLQKSLSGTMLDEALKQMGPYMELLMQNKHAKAKQFMNETIQPLVKEANARGVRIV